MNLTWKTCFRAGASLFLLYLCVNYWQAAAGLLGALIGAAAPLLIGSAIAYVLNILMRAYERLYFPKRTAAFFRHTRRPVCLVAALLTALAAVVLVVWLVVPQLISCISLLLAQLPGALEWLATQVAGWNFIPKNWASLLVNVNWQSRIGQVVELLASGIGGVVGTVFSLVSSVFSGAVTGVLSLVFAVYLLLGKERLGGQCRRLMARYLRPTVCEKAEYVRGVLDDCFSHYIVGQCTEALILGGLCAIGMWILGLPYAAMVGALVAFTALVPIVGAFIGAGVGAFMIATVSPWQAVEFLLFLVLLQQLEENLIYPRVVGSSIGLPGLWVLAAVTVGGGLFGVWGMLLGVPLAATCYRLIKQDVNRSDVPKKEDVQ